MQDIALKGENYTITYDEASSTITFAGTCRLWPEDYTTVNASLTELAAQAPERVILDLCRLEYLNSSGISMLTSFVINLRNQQDSKLLVIGNRAYPWQNYALRNFQRLLPAMELKIE
jgi:hypothetical protein